MSAHAATGLLESLSDRDLAILRSLQAYRLLTTRLIQRLHFATGHATLSAATRATTRVMNRLQQRGLVTKIRQRIGGVRQGSAGMAYHLGTGGESLLRSLNGGPRRRYVEPSMVFITHTLAVADLAVRLHESSTAGRFEVTRLETEPGCWRTFLGRHGAQEWLKPDLYAVTASGAFEDEWFLEADLASEHIPAVIRKAHVYQRYATTGAHQAEHEVFPAVVWVVPDAARESAIRSALASDQALAPELFRVVTAAAFDDFITAGNEIHGPPPSAEPVDAHQFHSERRHQ